MEALDPPTTLVRIPHCALLDVRETATFLRGHLAGSGCIPLAELRARRGELPPRAAPVLLVADDPGRAAEAARAVEALGYARVAYLAAPLAELEGGLADTGPPARLWHPSPFLERVLPSLPRGRALDLAAGAGREAVFLALQGFDAEAWDHDREILERAREMAARHGVRIGTRVYNLERRHPELPEADHQLVTVFRFLHRPLFPHVERAVAPGGCLIYETYLRGQERFGRPKHPRFLLDPGELPGAFPGLRTEVYEESTPPEGPFMARLLARKPG